MCGRSSLHDAPVNILEHFGIPVPPPEFRPRYNIAPSEEQLTISLGPGSAPTARFRRWGLIPSWADDPAIGHRLINARSDSIAGKPSFRDAFASRRCLIVADGYYEWTGKGKARVPFFFHMRDNRAFAIAGLWESWRRGDRSAETCTVITTDAGPLASRYHHRMPALLSLDAADEWLDEGTSPSRALRLLRPHDGEGLECHEVSRFVNTPGNDSPECIAPVGLLL